MSRWWAGAIGAVKKRQDENAAATESTLQSVALVVGSTGIVGTSLLDILPLQDTPGGPWKVYALSRRPLPPWSPPSSPAVTNLHLDLADSAAVADALEPLKDISRWGSRSPVKDASPASSSPASAPGEDDPTTISDMDLSSRCKLCQLVGGCCLTLRST